MDAPRRLLAVALGGLSAGIALAVVAVSLRTWAPDIAASPAIAPALANWSAAHGWILLAGALLPALAYLQFHLLGKYLKARLHDEDAQMLSGLYIAATILVPLGILFPDSLWPVRPFAVAGFAGFLLLAGTGMAQLLITIRVLPKGSVVDVQRDPLTKGDDACLKQIRFGHFFLPPGFLLVALSYGPGLADWSLAPALRLAGLHLVLAGYGLLATYGLSHLVVPRLSGIPAIAAGAIKGELHSSLLGFVLLTAGFLSRGTGASTGLLIAGGIFVFFGAFVFMGVLGANIMKNKSKTQRVTPEFAYVPWTFAGVFYLIAGVLLGVFLNAVPTQLPEFAHRLPALRFTHVHTVAFGGFVTMALGFVMRAAAPTTMAFQRTKLSFLTLNAGLIVMTVGAITSGLRSTPVAIGVLLSAAAVLLWLLAMRPHLRRTGA